MTSEVFDKVSDLVAPLGLASFERDFYHCCREIFGNDQCNVFLFEKGKAPKCLLSTASDREIRKLTRVRADEYISFGHGRDPTLAWAKSLGATSSRAQVRQVSQRDISDPVYRRNFYDRAAVRQKLAQISHSADRTFYLNLYRNPDQTDYSVDDRKQLSRVGGLLGNLLAKHYDIVCPRDRITPLKSEMSDSFQAQLLDRVKEALLAESAGLTAREADICAAIALGQSAAGIGLDYSISVNTVATHRKRAYAKLGISSQNELFARYYEGVTDQIRGGVRPDSKKRTVLSTFVRPSRS